MEKEIEVYSYNGISYSKENFILFERKQHLQLHIHNFHKCNVEGKEPDKKECAYIIPFTWSTK